MFKRRINPLFTVLLLVVFSAILVGVLVRASANSWKFVIFGDTRGVTPPYSGSAATGVSPVLPQIATKIASMNPEFVLHVGDLICGDKYLNAVEMGVSGAVAIPYDDQFQAFKLAVKPFTDAQIPLYTVRGNHEVSDMQGVNGNPDPNLAASYYRAFGQYMSQNDPNQKGLTYSFTHKQVTVVVVDQFSNYIKPDPAPVPWYKPENAGWGTNFWGYHTIDQAWVADQLHNATTPFKIVMAHEPIFIATDATFTPKSTDPDYHWSAELYFGPPEFGGQASRQQFVDMLGNNGVQLYAVGHVHNLTVGSFVDRAGHKMYQLTAGNGGALPMQSLPNPPIPEAALKDVQYELNKPGFTLVTIDPDANTMLMEYYVMDMDTGVWSKENFSTLIPGSTLH